MSRAHNFVTRAGRACVRHWALLLVACVAAGIFASQCSFLGDTKIDDAFITFSFSKNLALGHGPVYSHGVRVEGYSTFLWMILVAVPMIFTRGAAPLAGARLVGIPFILLLGWSVFRLARALGAPRAVAATCVLLLSFSTDLAAAYLTGMETLPYLAVLVFAFAATLLSFSQPRWEKWAAWGGLAVGLMRIDGFVPWGLLAGGSLVRLLATRGTRDIRRFFLVSGLPLIVYVGWFMWRWDYYGLFLPSTYYAKALIPVALPRRGVEYLWGEVVDGGLWFGLLGWLWLLWRRRAAGALVGCYVLIHWAYVVRVGGDWMPFGRFVLPTVPLLIVLLVVGGADAMAHAARSRSRGRWLVPILPVALVGMTAARLDHRFMNSDSEDLKLRAMAEQTENVNDYLRAAEFLTAIVPPNGRLVTDYGGVFACFTDAAIIDMWGLANATIATRGGTEGVGPIYGRTCPSCYPELAPEYFHVMRPLMRREPAFTSAEQVIANVWQSDTIGRYIDLVHTFVVGRGFSPRTGEALYFLQKRGKSFVPARRTTSRGLVIDYPFEKAS